MGQVPLWREPGLSPLGPAGETHGRETGRSLRLLLIILALLVAGVVLFLHLQGGRKVSRQADRAIVTQAQQANQLRLVDPSLVKWREVKRYQTVAQQPGWVTLEAPGTPYWCDTLHRIQGGPVIPLPFAVGPDGFANLKYAAARERVYVLAGESSNPWWRPLTQSLGERAQITWMALGTNDLWVADSGNRLVWHFDKRGKLLGSLGGRDDKDKARGLIVPSPHLKVVLKPDGDLLVNNPGRLRVDTYSPSGVLKSSFGRAAVAIDGFCGCCNPTDIALLPEGMIVTAEKGLPRVKVYRPDGTLDSVVVPPEGLSRRCEPKVATNPQGQVLVLDTPAGLLRVFERKP